MPIAPLLEKNELRWSCQLFLKLLSRNRAQAIIGDWLSGNENVPGFLTLATQVRNLSDLHSRTTMTLPPWTAWRLRYTDVYKWPAYIQILFSVEPVWKLRTPSPPPLSIMSIKICSHKTGDLWCQVQIYWHVEQPSGRNTVVSHGKGLSL